MVYRNYSSFYSPYKVCDGTGIDSNNMHINI